MSDYKAYAVLGVRLTAKECRKEIKEPPCSHDIPSGSAFCPHCGAKNKPITRFDPIIDEDSDFPVGMRLCDDTSNEMYFVGYTASVRDGGQGWNGLLFTDDRQPSVGRVTISSAEAEQSLKEFLEPLGLWKENRFGMWVILRWLG